jgi:hypothetical protein
MARILVGTDDGLHELGTDRVSLPGRSVRALAGGEAGWWAIAGDDDVVSDPLGVARPVASTAGLRATCLLSSRHGLLVGTSEARLFRVADGRLEPVDGFDHTEGRDDWYTPWGGPPDTRSMSQDSDGTLYVNVHVGGIPVSRDGERFRPTIDVDADVHQVLCHPDRAGWALAATAMGMARTQDAGETWTFETAGLHAPYCRAVGLAGDVVLLTASTGPRGGRAALYRGSPAGGPFECCRNGLPEWFDRNIDTHCLAADGGLAAFSTQDGRVFVSEDAGGSWREAGSGLPAVRCMAIAAGSGRSPAGS